MFLSKQNEMLQASHDVLLTHYQQHIIVQQNSTIVFFFNILKSKLKLQHRSWITSRVPPLPSLTDHYRDCHINDCATVRTNVPNGISLAKPFIKPTLLSVEGRPGFKVYGKWENGVVENGGPDKSRAPRFESDTQRNKGLQMETSLAAHSSAARALLLNPPYSARGRPVFSKMVRFVCRKFGNVRFFTGLRQLTMRFPNIIVF